MDHLHRAGDAQRARLADGEQARTLQRQERPHPLAAAQGRIAHRLEQPRVEAVALGQQGCERGLDRGGVLREDLVQTRGHVAAISRTRRARS
jgi:hypothetical protein